MSFANWAADQLETQGVPQQVIEHFYLLLKELEGSVEADGWRAPQHQLHFIADLLRRYANLMEETASGLENLGIELYSAWRKDNENPA